MDHHWPFVGNWIGFNNHKHFVLFNFYVTITWIHLVVAYLHGIIVFKFASKDSARFIVGYILPIVFLILVIMTSTFFTWTHILLDLLNVTTLETYTSLIVRPFDTGSYILNLKDSFGDPKTKLLWLLPIDPSSGCWRKKTEDNNFKMGSRWGDSNIEGHQYYFQVVN